MIVSKFLSALLLYFLLISCSEINNSTNTVRLKNLSEKTGIEMVVIDEAEKITQTNATRFVRNIILPIYTDAPIQSTITQTPPKEKTVELPGISFLVKHNLIEQLTGALNQKLAYGQYLAFISDNDTSEDKKQTISIINTTDKYNTLRLQQTSGGSYIFSTDSLITKLQTFEKNIRFILLAWVMIGYLYRLMPYQKTGRILQRKF